MPAAVSGSIRPGPNRVARRKVTGRWVGENDGGALSQSDYILTVAAVASTKSMIWQAHGDESSVGTVFGCRLPVFQGRGRM